MYRKTFCQPFLQFFRLLSRGARCCKCTARGGRCQICASAAAGGQQRHGHTPRKVMTYAAVPPVLQNGVVVCQNVKNAHELERILAAAPVTVGTSAEKMYTAVMLQRDPQNVAYFPEPEEITSIKRMDTPSPTGGRPAPNIVFRDNVSIPDTTVPRGTVNVNTQDMRSGAEYARLPRQVETGWQGRGTQYSIRNTRPMPWQDRITSCYDGSLKSSDGTTGWSLVQSRMRRCTCLPAWSQRQNAAAAEAARRTTWTGATFWHWIMNCVTAPLSYTIRHVGRWST